jgi:hypothetical protein
VNRSRQPLPSPCSQAVYAPGRNRTCDLALRRRTLYPLSYRREEASLSTGLLEKRAALLADRGAAVGTEVAVEVLHPVRLTLGELVVAGVERVVHVVVDRVRAR